MALLEIKNCLDPVLRKLCLPVENIDGELVTLAENMVETTLAAPGVGLAANQIGLPWRLFVVNIGVETDKENLVTVVNPEITAMEGSELGEEGCLSIPDVIAEVNRASQGKQGCRWSQKCTHAKTAFADLLAGMSKLDRASQWRC